MHDYFNKIRWFIGNLWDFNQFSFHQHKRLWLTKVALTLMHTLVISGMLVLFKPTLAWVWGQVLTADNNFHIIGVVLLFALFIRGIFTKKLRFKLTFIFKQYPFLVLIAGCICFLLNERFTGIHIFSAALMLVALYGLLGFYLSHSTWSKAFLPFTLLILLLPFEGYLDIYLGFPLRLFSAEVAKSLLANFGIAALSSQSVILIENKAAIVDLSCSGLKGLWAGLIFYLFLTWIENKKISMRWLLGLTLFAGVLVGFNILRIIGLVSLDLVLNLPSMASYAHTTLGVLGFVFACIFGWYSMRFQLDQAASKSHELTPASNKAEKLSQNNETRLSLTNYFVHVPNQYGLLLLIIILGSCSLLYQPFPKQERLNTHEAISLPTGFTGAEAAFSSIEQNFFVNNLANAKKYQFEWEGYQGSLIFVYSHYWKSQHDPRNCYVSQNITVDYEKTLTLPSRNNSNRIEVKYLQLNGGKNTGFYWFQSPTKQTADFSSRVFSGWASPTEPWVMVSVAWEDELSALQTEKFVNQVYSHIDKYF